MSNQYTPPNSAERAHLDRVIARLSPSDYGRPAGGPGWTIGGLLAHLAFWDNRALVLLAKWKKEGIGPSLIDTDVFNESMRPLCNAVPVEVIAKMAVETAAAIDEEIDSLSPDFLAKVERDGTPVRLNRGLHRSHHLAQVEKAIE
ncbi:MAG: maleylpyruvate isomerase N-terminal domain-containing protein [Spirochaetia bacterium]|jgi:hypothetical protein